MADRQSFPPGDRHAADFVAWERQIADASEPGEHIPYGLVCAVVVTCGGALLVLGDGTLGVAVLILAGVISVLRLTLR